MNPAEPPGGLMPDVAFAHRATGTELDAINYTPDRRFRRAEYGSADMKWRALEPAPGINAGTETDDQPGSEMAVEPGGIFQQQGINH